MTVDATAPQTAPEETERVALARTLARLAKHVEVALAHADVSPPQYRLLAYLSRGGELASVLAGQLDVSRPTITALVDNLVAKGLVERVPDPDDRRCISHVITDAGRAVLAAGDEALATHLDELTELLPAAQARRARLGVLAWSDAMRSYHQALIGSGGVKR